MSAVALRAEINRNAPSGVSDDLVSPGEIDQTEIRERMSGNLCRCGAHNGIIDAISEYLSEDVL